MKTSAALPARLERTIRITPTEHAVTDAVQFAELAVTLCCAECREAVALAACELAENVAKYGVPPPEAGEARAGTISVGIEGDLVRVRAANAVRAPNDAKCVLALIDRVAATPSVADLYRSRLRELFADPGAPRAQLGLLRLAFEGGFKLSATYEAPVLQIVAERSCESP